MKKDLVVLFFPKTEPDNIYKNVPISLLKIGSQLVADGYRVKIIDSRFDEDYENTIESSLDEALCFGISTMTGYPIYLSVKASRIVKKINKEMPVIWGGWHCSILPDETIRNDFIDIVVRGQGEAAIVEVVRALSAGSGLDGIKGVSFKDANAQVVHNPDRPFQNVNDFAGVNFDILDISRYINETPLGSRTVFWNTSQGCPYHCGFCCTAAVYSRRWSSVKAERTLDEIEVLVKRYGVNGILFSEDNFFTDENRVKAVCEGLISRNLKIRWSTDARIDKIIKFPDEFFSLLKRSGCAKLYLGAESGDQEILNLIDKRIKVEDTVKAAELLHRHDILAEFFLIVGFPLNPERDLQKTMEMMRQIKEKYPDHQATPFLYTPYPGTKLFNIAVEKKLSVPKKLEDWIRWTQVAPTAPWINKRYADKVDRLVKFYFPFAYPSQSLLSLMRDKRFGFLYRMMHRLARARVRKNFFWFPLEWHLAKYFYYKIKMKYSLFKKLAVPR